MPSEFARVFSFRKVILPTCGTQTATVTSIEVGGMAWCPRPRIQGNRMKKPADKTNPQYLPGVCRLIRGNAHNRLNGLLSTTNTANTAAPAERCPASLPTPSPLSCHTYENNDVTSIMTQNACQNKQLRFRSLSEIRRKAAAKTIDKAYANECNPKPNRKAAGDERRRNRKYCESALESGKH